MNNALSALRDPDDGFIKKLHQGLLPSWRDHRKLRLGFHVLRRVAHLYWTQLRQIRKTDPGILYFIS